MDPILKAKWLEALRSNKYKQGQYCLRDCNDNFCCLGVLADVVNPEGWITEKEKDYFSFVKDGISGFLPTAILDFDTQLNLSAKNDEGNSFEVIADYIEKYL